MRTSHAEIQGLLQKYYAGSDAFEQDSALGSLLLWQLVVLGATSPSNEEMAKYAELINRHLHKSSRKTFCEIEEECCRFIWLKFPAPSQAEEFWTFTKSCQ
jgi:hypothetical protein